jgi:exodeoxyribonuclease-3
MKIFSWNIRHGGGKRINEILHELEDNQDSKIILITEFRNNQNGILIRDKLNELGFIYQRAPIVNAGINSLLIASKIAVTFREYPELYQHQHRVISAEWNDSLVFGTYFPQKNEKSQVFQFLIQKVKEASLKSMIIVAGDMNTGVPFKDEKGKSFYCAKDFNQLQKAGVTDAWRLINNEQTEYSWYSNHGNGFRIDHFLISNQFRNKVDACYYIHEARKNRISDHSQMCLIINP